MQSALTHKGQAALWVTNGCTYMSEGAPVAQWVKHRPTDLADRVRSLPEVKSAQP